MAEFVEVGGADFPGKDFGIAFGEVPEVVQIQDDARGRVGGVGVGLEAAGALEEAEEAVLDQGFEPGLVGDGLVEGDDGVGGGAEFGGQAGADALHTANCQLVKFWIHRMRLGSGFGLRKSAASKVFSRGDED